MREYVVEHLHDEAAVLVVDEPGDVKKGIHTVGVQRQYTGTAGRIENSPAAVYLVCAGARGHTAVDREPLPATSRIPDMKIAIHSWSTKYRVAVGAHGDLFSELGGEGVRWAQASLCSRKRRASPGKRDCISEASSKSKLSPISAGAWSVRGPQNWS